MAIYPNANVYMELESKNSFFIGDLLIHSLRGKYYCFQGQGTLKFCIISVSSL